MAYFPPFAVMGTHNLDDEALANHAKQYSDLIDLLQQDYTLGDFNGCAFLNDIPELNNA